VGTTIGIEDVVGEGLDAFGVGVGVLQGDLDLSVLDSFIDVKNVVVNDVFTDIKVFDVALDTAFKVEAVTLASLLVF